jgi:hypothetical protein
MLDINVESLKLRTDLKAIRADQMPFALSLGINNTAKGARDRMKFTELPHDFTINPARQRFMASLIRFPRAQWATKRKLSATLGVHERDEDVGVGSSKDRGFLLGRHEEGGARQRTDDARPFFIPTEALRQGDTALAPRSMFPTALRLFASQGIVRYVKISVDGKTKRKGVKGQLPAQAKGKRGTFIVDARQKDGPSAWGIFQRYGRGKRDIRMIWAFRKKVQLPPRLKFYATVNQYVTQNFGLHFSEAMDQATRTAK